MLANGTHGHASLSLAGHAFTRPSHDDTSSRVCLDGGGSVACMANLRRTERGSCRRANGKQKHILANRQSQSRVSYAAQPPPLRWWFHRPAVILRDGHGCGRATSPLGRGTAMPVIVTFALQRLAASIPAGLGSSWKPDTPAAPDRRVPWNVIMTTYYLTSLTKMQQSLKTLKSYAQPLDGPTHHWPLLYSLPLPSVSGFDGAASKVPSSRPLTSASIREGLTLVL